jgi:hypothetical protein
MSDETLALERRGELATQITLTGEPREYIAAFLESRKQR